MAILGIPIEMALRIERHEITRWFERYARYTPDSPHLCYAIRVGSKTLFSDDTYDLRKQFGREIGRIKRAAKNKLLTRN